uniref:Uncharacterized protein n=1 Tax=Coccidioides posadasii RMSCC 3488 TaxID=454284 RepID=A0A0J6INE8_COCPO|nr:hypothetical protein CPAG_09731 [Coccidioides posadasii RMSCC 3488]
MGTRQRDESYLPLPPLIAYHHLIPPLSQNDDTDDVCVYPWHVCIEERPINGEHDSPYEVRSLTVNLIQSFAIPPLGTTAEKGTHMGLFCIRGSRRMKRERSGSRRSGAWVFATAKSVRNKSSRAQGFHDASSLSPLSLSRTRTSPADGCINSAWIQGKFAQTDGGQDEWVDTWPALANLNRILEVFPISFLCRLCVTRQNHTRFLSTMAQTTCCA